MPCTCANACVMGCGATPFALNSAYRLLIDTLLPQNLQFEQVLSSLVRAMLRLAVCKLRLTMHDVTCAICKRHTQSCLDFDLRAMSNSVAIVIVTVKPYFCSCTPSSSNSTACPGGVQVLRVVFICGQQSVTLRVVDRIKLPKSDKLPIIDLLVMKTT